MRSEAKGQRRFQLSADSEAVGGESAPEIGRRHISSDLVHARDRVPTDFFSVLAELFLVWSLVDAEALDDGLVADDVAVLPGDAREALLGDAYRACADLFHVLLYGGVVDPFDHVARHHCSLFGLFRY